MSASLGHERRTAEPAVVERRPATPRDTVTLRALYADAREDLLVLPTDSRDLIVDMRFRAARRRVVEEHPGARWELIVADGAVVGMAVLADEIASVHLVELTVCEQQRGRGIGGEVLAAVLADADATRRTVRTRVCVSNRGAQRFCERFGFAVGAMLGGRYELFRPPAELV